jgi:hypothetical protein
MARAANTASERADLLSIERRWLKLARSDEAKSGAPPRKKHSKDGD